MNLKSNTRLASKPARMLFQAEESVMSTAKQDVELLLNKLPDDCSVEDIQYHLYVLDKVRTASPSSFWLLPILYPPSHPAVTYLTEFPADSVQSPKVNTTFRAAWVSGALHPREFSSSDPARYPRAI